MTHEERVEHHRRALEAFNAPMTRENLMHLGDVRARTARRDRARARLGSAKHYGWRRDYLQTARAFYTLARRVAK